jgi:hypothetical protein
MKNHKTLSNAKENTNENTGLPSGFRARLVALTLIVFTCLFTLLTACDPSSNQKNSNGEKKLVGKAFQMGSTKAETSGCTLELACDCCSINLVFDNNGKCYWIEPCEGDITVFSGTYTLEEGELIAVCESNAFVKEYNWESETDAHATPYHYIEKKDAESKKTLRGEITECDGKLKLTLSGGTMVGFSDVLDFTTQKSKAESIIEKARNHKPHGETGDSNTSLENPMVHIEYNTKPFFKPFAKNIGDTLVEGGNAMDQAFLKEYIFGYSIHENYSLPVYTHPAYTWGGHMKTDSLFLFSFTLQDESCCNTTYLVSSPLEEFRIIDITEVITEGGDGGWYQNAFGVWDSEQSIWTQTSSITEEASISDSTRVLYDTIWSMTYWDGTGIFTDSIIKKVETERWEKYGD